MKKTIFIQLVFLLLTTTVFSQTDFMVSVKKAGKLQKCLKKNNWLNVEKLKIEGILNCDDIAFIASLPKIKSLNLEDAYYVNNEKSEYRDSYLKTLSITGVNNLLEKQDEFNLQDEFNSQDIYDLLDTQGQKINKIIYLYIPCIPTLEELVLPEDLLFIADKMHLKKVTFAHRSYLPYIDSKIKDIVGTNNDNFEIYSIESDEFLNSKHNLSTDTLDFNICNCSRYSRFVINETFLVGRDRYGKTKTMLAHWKDSLDIAILGQVDSILPGAFKDSKMQDLRLPDNFTELKSNFISGWESLRTIDLNNVRRINSKAFAGCVSLKEIKCNNLLYIDKEAFYKTNISKITLPECFERIHPDAFEGSNIKEVEFKGIYPIYINKEGRDEYCELPKHIDYITPDGVDKIKLYKADGTLLDERYYPSFLNKSAQTEFVFNIEEPGTLSEKITDKIKNDARKITVSGTLYENDYAALVGCKHLRYLDLTNCTFKYSPYYIESSYNTSIMDDIYAEQQARMILGALDASGALAAMGISSKSEEEKERPLFFEELSDSTRAYIISDYNKKFDFYGKWKYLREIRFPDNLLEAHEIGSVFVEKIKFPSCATYVDCSYYKLVDVELPQNVERIDISGCRSLRNINFPESLKELSAGGVLENIEILDLSKTKIENINLDYTPLLKELHLPETLKEVGHLGLFDKDSMNWGEYQKYNIHCIIYFNSPTPPEGLSRTELKYAKAVYIPKGSKNAYARGELRSINFIEQQ